jgi:hypothetical protein
MLQRSNNVKLTKMSETKIVGIRMKKADVKILQSKADERRISLSAYIRNLLFTSN